MAGGVTRLVEFYGGPWDGRIVSIPWRWLQLQLPVYVAPPVRFDPIVLEPPAAMPVFPRHLYEIDSATAQYIGMIE